MRLRGILMAGIWLASIAAVLPSSTSGAARFDPDYGVEGRAIQNGGNGGAALDLSIDSRGRAVTVGGAEAGDCPSMFASRFTVRGVPDASFGGAGFVVGERDCELATALVSLSGERTLQFGYNYCRPDLRSNCFLVSYKLNANGFPATGWGFSAIPGRRIVQAGGLIPNDAVAAGAGRLLVAGRAEHGRERSGGFIMRFNKNGELDRSFRGPKALRTRVPGIIKLLPPGESTTSIQRVANVSGSRILASGWFRGKLLAARFTRKGTPDKTFGKRGFFSLDLDRRANCECTRGYAMARDRRGRIVLGGAQGSFYAHSFSRSFRSFLVRLTPEGRLDRSFGKRGMVSPLMNRSSIRSLAIQKDGKIVASGTQGYKGFVARFHPNGRLDQGFFDGGLLRSLGPAEAQEIKIDRRGRILIGGSSESGGAQVMRLLPD